MVQIFHLLISSFFKICTLISREKNTIALAKQRKCTLDWSWARSIFFLTIINWMLWSSSLFLMIPPSPRYSGLRFCHKNYREPFWCSLHVFSMSSNVVNIDYLKCLVDTMEINIFASFKISNFSSLWRKKRANVE